jgi:hypothetical protein
VVDRFKLYTFDFGHIFSRAIGWKKFYFIVNSLNFCKIYEQVLIFFLLLSLSVLCSAAQPIAGVFPGRQLPLRRSSCATWPPARSPAAQSTPLAPPRVDASCRCPPELPHALSTINSYLPPARTPLYSLGTRPVNFSFLLSPRARPHSCSHLHSTTLPELLCPPPSAISATSPLQFHAPPAPPHLIAPS